MLPFLIPLYRFGSAKIGVGFNLQNFFSVFLKKINSVAVEAIYTVGHQPHTARQSQCSNTLLMAIFPISATPLFLEVPLITIQLRMLSKLTV